MAYGRLGWDEDRFLSSKPEILYKALKGFNELEDERNKSEWERLRILGSWVIAPYSNDMSLTPSKLLPLPWDEKKDFLKENEHLIEAWERLENG